MKSLYNTALAKVELFKLNGSREFKHIDIPKIPEEWTKIIGSDNMHISVPAIDGYTACLYIGNKGSVFPPHKHVNNSEQFTILNEGGEIEVITSDEIEIVKFPNSYYIEANKVHALKFNADTKIICMWTPAFKDHIIDLEVLD